MKHGDYGIYLTVVPEDVLVVYEGSWFQDVYNGKGYLYILASPKL